MANLVVVWTLIYIVRRKIHRTPRAAHSTARGTAKYVIIRNQTIPDTHLDCFIGIAWIAKIPWKVL